INNLKLRVSYGVLGNERLPSRYGSLGSYRFSNYNGASAAYPNNVSNPDLKWESKSSLDIGVDFALFNNRISGVVNYFKTKTSHLLFLENLAQETGEPGSPASRYTNFGSFGSSGVEVELIGDIFRTENFKWTLGGSISFVKNLVNTLPNGADYTPSGYNLILQEGQEVYTHYLVRYAGVNPANGRAQYYDKTGKITEKYNGDDAVPLKGKTVSPDFDGSFNTLFNYKGLSLSANFYFKYGNYIYNNQEAGRLSDGNSIINNQGLDALNFWKNPGDTNVLPDARNSSNTSEDSDRFLQDGSYIRLRSLKLGYELPKKWIAEKSFLKSVNLYVQGQNLWTYVPYFKGDPEVGIGSDEASNGSPSDVGFIPGAYNLYSYPTLRSFLLGLDITF
ncbi:MAG: SusC/RagA family TonB-linked outer membrane protein, partial [Polaribacter sp.]